MMQGLSNAEVPFKLFESTVITPLLNNCESWIGIKDQQINLLQKFQEEFIEKVLRISNKTTKAIDNQLGCRPTTYEMENWREENAIPEKNHGNGLQKHHKKSSLPRSDYGHKGTGTRMQTVGQRNRNTRPNVQQQHKVPNKEQSERTCKTRIQKRHGKPKESTGQAHRQSRGQLLLENPTTTTSQSVVQIQS